MGPIENEILTDLHRRYPNGFRCLSPRGLKRVPSPIIAPTRRGWKTNINGDWHHYSPLGKFLTTEGNRARHAEGFGPHSDPPC